MSFFKEYVGKEIILDLPGANQEGTLVDYGSDMTVLYNGQTYIYIPTAHIHQCRLNPEKTNDRSDSPMKPFVITSGKISYLQILESAKDLFIEIAVSGKGTVYGTIAKILDDYFVFLSPIQKTLLVPLEHLKWLALLSRQQTFYSLSKQELKQLPQLGPPAATFQAQLKSLIGNVITVDLANSPQKSGLLKEVTGEYLQLITAQEEVVWHNFKHIQVINY